MVGAVAGVLAGCATSEQWAEWRSHNTHFASGTAPTPAPAAPALAPAPPVTVAPTPAAPPTVTPAPPKEYAPNPALAAIHFDFDREWEE